MVISLKHKKNVSIPDDPAAAAAGQVVSSNWNDEHDLTMATARLLGRVTAGAGVVEELTAAQVLALLGVAAGATANQTDSYLLSRANHTGTQPQSTITNLTTDLAARLLLSGGTMTGPLTLNADPASALQAATKQYVDGLLLNMGRRSRVRAATTGNITISTGLNSGDVIDGVTLANGDLVLVKDQTTASQNGVYVVGASPARSTEFDAWDEFPGALIGVAEGTSNDNTLWFCTSNTGGTLGTTSITFTQFRVAGELLAANNLSDLANAATARTNLGLAIGSQVQAYSNILTALAALDPVANDGKTFKFSGGTIVAAAADAGGAMNKDPRLLGVYDVTGYLWMSYSGSTGDATSQHATAPFWTQVSKMGAIKTANPGNNTWSTICDVTGMGMLNYVIPPDVANTTDTVDIRVTIDGTAYTITRTAFYKGAGEAGRLVLGPVLTGTPSNYYTDFYKNFSNNGANNNRFNKAGDVGTANVAAYMIPPSDILLNNFQACFFTSSLKVEVRVSGIDTSYTYGPYHGAVYMLLG